MAKSVLVDAGFLVAILNDRDANHRWAERLGSQYPPPWKCCDAVLSETFYLAGKPGSRGLDTMLRRGAVVSGFHLGNDVETVLELMQKYGNLPMSFADACLVRMTETHPDPIILTTDTDFRIYRRHGRHVVPCVLPD
jgi:predicted nucleic acid-binding protein